MKIRTKREVEREMSALLRRINDANEGADKIQLRRDYCHLQQERLTFYDDEPTTNQEDYTPED